MGKRSHARLGKMPASLKHDAETPERKRSPSSAMRIAILVAKMRGKKCDHLSTYSTQDFASLFICTNELEFDYIELVLIRELKSYNLNSQQGVHS